MRQIDLKKFRQYLDIYDAGCPFCRGKQAMFYSGRCPACSSTGKLEVAPVRECNLTRLSAKEGQG